MAFIYFFCNRAGAIIFAAIEAKLVEILMCGVKSVQGISTFLSSTDINLPIEARLQGSFLFSIRQSYFHSRRTSSNWEKTVAVISEVPESSSLARGMQNFQFTKFFPTPENLWKLIF